MTWVFWNAVGYYAVRCPRDAPRAPPAAGAANGELKPIEMAEVARHARADDCWLVIDGKVYSVGPFMDVHPGDSGLMLTFCGKDGTERYMVKASGKEKGKRHSPRADEFLEEYLIGRLAGK